MRLCLPFNVVVLPIRRSATSAVPSLLSSRLAPRIVVEALQYEVVVAVMGGETVLLVVVLIEVDHRDSGLDIEKEDLIEQITEEVDHL